jgi:hypothetical protein
VTARLRWNGVRVVVFLDMREFGYVGDEKMRRKTGRLYGVGGNEREKGRRVT